MNLLLISFIEAIYVIYMLNYFKTKYSIAHPFTYFNNKYLFHPLKVFQINRNQIFVNLGMMYHG